MLELQIKGSFPDAKHHASAQAVEEVKVAIHIIIQWNPSLLVITVEPLTPGNYSGTPHS